MLNLFRALQVLSTKVKDKLAIFFTMGNLSEYRKTSFLIPSTKFRTKKVFKI